MPVLFPASLDNFTNPTPNDRLSTPTVLHTDLHTDANDAIEALQAKVGINGSLVTGSLDYRVNFLASGSHSPVTLGTANGLSLSGQALSLGLSATGTSGALSAIDYSRIAFKDVVNVFTANQIVDAHAAVGADSVIDYDPFVSGAKSVLSVVETFTTASSTVPHNIQGVISALTANPSVSASQTDYRAMRFEVLTEAGNSQPMRLMAGVYGGTTHNGDNDISLLSGITAIVGNYGGGDIGENNGEYVYTDHYGSGNVTSMSGLYLDVWGGGTIGTLYGIRLSANNDGGTITNFYGLKIDDVSGAGTLNFAIYTGAGDVSLGDNLFLRVIKSGATQVAASAAANELWVTNGHATLPNNVVMRGV